MKDKLAIHGGPSVRGESIGPWPYYADDEIQAVTDVLRSGRVNYWTSDVVENFETAYASYVGVKYAVAVSNGTLALELGLRSLGLGSGDEVIVTSRTFVASASSIVTVGARPVFADVDASSQNITAKSIESVITDKTRAIMLVHLAGWPCEFYEIQELAGRYKLKLIEDCAQAHGATYHGRPVGSFGDVAAFSFCQDKIITTGGEGGMLTTNSREIWQYAWSYKDHGKDYDSTRLRQSVGFQRVHHSFGSNWRLTAIQAAIGLKQLDKLDVWQSIRERNATILNEGLRDLAMLRITIPPTYIRHAYYKYYVFLRPEHLKKGWSRDKVVAAIQAEGVSCFTGSCSEVYLERAFQASGLAPDRRLPVAKELGETSMMMLVHPTLSESDIQDTISAVRKVVRFAEI